MHRITLILRYTLFALLSTGANLLVQWFSYRILSVQYRLSISILSGTGAGLILKYYLDKHFIFNYYTKSRTHNVQKFVVYTMTGLITTAVFWSFELAFNYMFAQDYARYAGALIGLTIGYTIKYSLDKKFVFSH